MAVKIKVKEGDKYSNWVILQETQQRDPRKVLCRCICGVEKEIFLASLISGKSKSCGCNHPSKLNVKEGDRFGRYVVVEEVSKTRKGNRKFLCRCDCGTIREVDLGLLRAGRSQSCGCLQKEKNTKHGLTKQPLYYVWRTMRDRCYNKNKDGYSYYGGRGIKVCNEWIHDPLAFYNWMMSNGYKKGMQIDRIDCSGDYSPFNCRVVTRIEQMNNKRDNKKYLFNNHMLTIPQICRELGMEDKISLVRQRMDRGCVDVNKAIIF